MAIQLLKAAGAGVTSPVVDMHSCGKDFVHARILATGTFAVDLITVEHSPDSGLNWFPLGTLGKALDEFVVEDPVDWIRARTGAAQTGVANVYIEPSA